MFNPQQSQEEETMMTIYSHWEERKYPAFITADCYANNGRLAVVVWIHEETDFAEPWASLTVNLDRKFSKDGNAFIDVNNFPDAEEFIKANHLGQPTGYVAASGFCLYPEYKLDLEMIDMLTAK